MSDDRHVIPPVQDPAAAVPARILAFEAPRGERERSPIDLDTPFFTVKTPSYSECDHREHGVTLEMGQRKAHCRGCDAELDLFDALLIYARAQERLVNTRHVIEEHRQREAEKKAKLPFGQDVVAWERRVTKGKRPRFLGWILKLACGHHKEWWRKRQPRRATCEHCYRAAKLREKGVAAIGRAAPSETLSV